jgi:UDP-N-acetylglucosamine 2-epimerase (non-hydrolysing)
MKLLSIVGARPQFVKLAPIAQALAGRCDHVIVHTGQHYDDRLSQVFFDDLAIPRPDVDLGVGSASHGVQTGLILAALDPVLAAEQPDWVIVYGDTNSTLAGALAAVKLHLPLAHLEAGLRSFNRRMPEEHNRVLTDHAADLCLAPTELAMKHLANEGLADRARLVGDVMTDVCLATAAKVRDSQPSLPTGVTLGGYVVATIHRADNTDDPVRLRAIVEALAALADPVLLLAHPRILAAAEGHGIDLGQGSVHVLPAQPYPELLRLVLGACAVVTDSGGLQKEAFLLRVPCTTIRTETEWPETVALGWNALCPNPADLPGLINRPEPPATDGAPYGDGHAAERVADLLLGKDT